MMVRVYYYAERSSIHRFQAERKMTKNSIILPITILLGEKNEKPTGASKSIFFFEFRSLSFTSQYVTNIIPNIGKAEMKTYGKTAKKVEGSKIFILI